MGSIAAEAEEEKVSKMSERRTTLPSSSLSVGTVKLLDVVDQQSVCVFEISYY